MSTSQFLMFQINRNLEAQKKQKARKKKQVDIDPSTNQNRDLPSLKETFVPRVAKLKDYSSLHFDQLVIKQPTASNQNVANVRKSINESLAAQVE